MKTRIATVLLLFFYCSIFSQNVHIPDPNFKNYLVTNSAVNTNNDTEIQVSEASSFTGTLAFQFWFVSDLTGIEAFTNLTILDCGDNNLTNIDLSQNLALEQLYCYDNQITSLDLSANVNLVALDCRDNQISSLDLSNNPLLYYLNCPFNGMISLNVSNTAMQTLRCYSNNLTNLNITNVEPTLETLLVYNNSISELDLSSYTSLSIFECGNSSAITSLNIANSNNTNISNFNALNTPNLECIQVDDVAYSTANWTNIDATTIFSEDCTLSIPEFNNQITSIYPIPAMHSLNLNALQKDIYYTIFSIKGKKITGGDLILGENKLNVNHLKTGIYILQTKTTDGKSFSVRFVKK